MILSGSATLLLGDERIPMKEGDYVCFPAGQKVGHALLNESDAVCRFLIIGEDKKEEVVVYTSTNKVLVRALQTRLRLTEFHRLLGRRARGVRGGCSNEDPEKVHARTRLYQGRLGCG